MPLLLRSSSCLLYVLLLVVAGGLLLSPAHAQVPPRVFNHLTVDDGLTSNVGATLVQDAQGFIWIGTDQGLNRYDGRAVKHFRNDPADSTSLDFDNVADLHVDQQGRLWVSTHSGVLHRYDPTTESFRRYPLPQLDGMPTVVEIHESRDGTFWLSAWQRGLWHFHPEQGVLANYQPDPDDPSTIGHPVVKDVLENPDGTLWLATYAGLNHFDPQTGRATRYPLPIQESHSEMASYANIAWAVHRDRWGALWVGTFGGLYRFVPETSTYVPYFPEPGNPLAPRHHEVHRIIEDHEGYVWIGYGAGVDRFDPRTGVFESMVHDPHVSSSLADGYITALHQDRSGVLWVGTDRGGVSRTDLAAQRIVFHQTDVNGTTAGLIDALYEDRSGTLWLAAESGLLRVDQATGRITVDDSLPSQATALWEDREGSMWAAVHGHGIGRVQPSGAFELVHAPGDLDNLINTAVPARDGGVWVGGSNGFYHWSPETHTATPYRPVAAEGYPNGKRHSFVMALLEEKNGIVWAGTEKGVRRLDPATGRLTEYEHDTSNPNSIQPGGIRTLHQDHTGAVWVAGPFGLSRFDEHNGHFTRFNTANGALPTNAIHALLEDEAGVFWLHTDRGILRFDPRTGDVYNAMSIIVGLPIDVSFGAFHRNAQGTLFFGTLGGYYAFTPSDLVPNRHPPRVVLTELRVADALVSPQQDAYLHEAITTAQQANLSYHDRLFSVDFAALHFSQPEANIFSYQLEGFDPDWRGPTRYHSATYTNLDPGTYTFRVRAANSDGVWSHETTDLTVVIAPPWWQTWWFRVMASLWVVGLISGAFVWRIRNIQHQTDVLEQEVAERTREIEAQRLELERQARKLLALDEMKSNFFANTSHELRTPLTLIQGNLDDVVQSPDHTITDEGRGYLRVAMHQTNRLQQLVEQLLDLSRVQSKQMPLYAQYGNASTFLSDLVSAFDAVAQQRGLTLRFERPTAPSWLYFDADKLEKIITNLLGNALKFTPAGGEIHLSLAETVVGGDGLGTGEFVAISVRDTGEGVPPEALPYIFDRFYQADGSVTRAREGMGVGLALAQELAHLHGGTIRCESVVGKGTTFIVLLPKGRSHLADEEIGVPSFDEVTVSSQGIGISFDEEPFPSDAPKASNPEAETILVVEDNRDLRQYLMRHLGTSYRVLEAENGAVGMQLAQQYRPDLILSDVMMPEMDGFSLLRALKGDPDLATTPVVLLTARASEADEQAGLAAEAIHYIAKPFKIKDVEMRVANVLKDRARLKAMWGASQGDGALASVTASEDALFLRKVDAFVEAHLQDSNLTVKVLAEALHMGDRTFRRRLQEAVGMTAAAYIRQVRLTYAKQRLEARIYGTVSEAAAAVGFNNAHYFARVFKQTFGISPSDLLRLVA